MRCQECRGAILSDRRTNFCSKRCCDKFYARVKTLQRQEELSQKPSRDLTCAGCFSVFQTKDSRVIYCSASCRQAGYGLSRSLKRLGMTFSNYVDMMRSQKGKCRICGKRCASKARLSIDHNHKTGQIRELLCSRCNLALGHFNDDPQLLIEAAMYLWRHAWSPIRKTNAWFASSDDAA